MFGEHGTFPRLPRPLSRRKMLLTASNGFGLTALSALMADPTYAGLSNSGTMQHHSARARNVIFCFMAGGVSHVDSFDPKPALVKQHGKSVGDLSGQKKTQNNGSRTWKESPWKFRPYGSSGIPVSELFPHIGGYAHRSATGGLAQHWILDHVWPGQREPQLAGVHAAGEWQSAAGWTRELRKWLSAG